MLIVVHRAMKDGVQARIDRLPELVRDVGYIGQELARLRREDVLT